MKLGYSILIYLTIRFSFKILIYNGEHSHILPVVSYVMIFWMEELFAHKQVIYLQLFRTITAVPRFNNQSDQM